LLKPYQFWVGSLAAYITFQLVSGVTAGKIIHISSFTVSVTVLYLPITYLFGEVVT